VQCERELRNIGRAGFGDTRMLAIAARSILKKPRISNNPIEASMSDMICNLRHRPRTIKGVQSPHKKVVSCMIDTSPEILFRR
jgi:hypothetical protein